MAEEPGADEKTEEPSERKLDEAIRKGNVPFSRETVTFASLLGILICLIFLAPDAVLTLSRTLSKAIEHPGSWPLTNTQDAISLLRSLVLEVAGELVPVLAVLLVAGVAAALAQNSPRLAFQRIKPDKSRLSLAKGWKRLFGTEGLVQFGIALFKFVALSLVGAIVLQAVRWDIFNTMLSHPVVLLDTLQSVLMASLAAMSVAAIAIAVADLSWSRVRWYRQQRMTREEVKNEQKQLEGDPVIKSRIRSIARDRARKRMMARVPEATVVIVNPTHYAVALRYQPDKDAAPLVLAKGLDLIALKMREIAREHGVPVVEDKSLARPLHDSVEVDQRIPPEFYRAVAKIVLFLNTNRIG